MKSVFAFLLLGVLPLLCQQPSRLRGFLANEIAEGQNLEKQAQTAPNQGRLRRYMDFMAGEPRNAGSPHSKVVAEYVLGNFKEWGLDAHIEEFEALLPFPTLRHIEVVGPKRFVLKLNEPAVPEDPNSGDVHQLPTYNAYGASTRSRFSVYRPNWVRCPVW